MIRKMKLNKKLHREQKGKRMGQMMCHISLLLLLAIMGAGCGNNAVDPVTTSANTSDDPFENLSDNDVANNSFDDVTNDAEVVNNPTDSDVPVMTTQPEEVSANNAVTFSVDDVTDVNNNIYIANMSGKNITSLYLTFHVESMNEIEVLGEESLKDGSLFTYVTTDMRTLVNQANLSLTIRGVLRDGEEISFGTVNVINPSGMTLVLSTNEEGYYVYVD